MPRPLDPFRDRVARALWLRRLAGLACLGLLALYALAGCQAPSIAGADWPDWASFRSQSPDEDEEEEGEDDSTPGTKLETPLIGEYVTAFGGTSLIAIEGVGLVTGLDNTGEDPPPSQYRTRLQEEMKKRGVEKPNEVLARPSTAMVIVRAYLPVGIRKGDPFDVEVSLPPNSRATSLRGGYLLEARLADQAVVQGRLLDGDIFGTAAGPILVSTTTDKSAGAGVLRRGRILGGGKSKVDRDLAIYLKNEYRSGRNTTRIAEAIGKRFHGHDKHGIKEPMAKAKDDRQITLKVPEEYQENIPRYLSVIRKMAFRETDLARRVRMQKLEENLKNADTCETAALGLEGMGDEGLPSLKRALGHKDIEVRFNAGMALTYMGQPDGLEKLVEAAREEPAFRVYALAALAASREAKASTELRTLLKETSPETRYGAFRALTVLNARDPAVAGIDMADGDYTLHPVDEGGPPLVHLTHHTKAEVVLFGPDQRLQLPAVLRAGPHIQVVGQQGTGEVVVSRYSGGKNVRKVVSQRLDEIIKACDELGATYPDVADLLTQASQRKNLPGELAIDALPTAGRTYTAKDSTGKRRIGSEYTAPTIFAPPTSEAAAARDADIKEVRAEEPEDKAAEKDDEKGGEKDGKKGGEILPAGGEADAEPAVTTADAESPADGGRAPGAEGPDGEPTDGEPTVDGGTPTDDSPNAPDQTAKRKWFDPRGVFKKPSWAGEGAPVQSEPEVE